MPSVIEIFSEMDWVDFFLPVITKYVDADVVLSLYALDVLNRSWKLNSIHFELICILPVLFNSIYVASMFYWM